MKRPSSLVLLFLLLGIVSGTILLQDQHRQLVCTDTRIISTYPDMSNAMDFQMEFFKNLVLPIGHKKTSMGGNFLMSPHSMWSGLIMTYFGARDRTQRQMEQVLRLHDKSSTFYLWRELDAIFQPKGLDARYEFTMVNRIYYNESLQMNPLALDLLKKEMHVFNSNHPRDAVQEANNFVLKATKGRVTEIMTEGDMEQAQMVLLNTAYFNGTWAHQFSTSQTSPRMFFIDSQTNVSVNMMNQSESFRYGHSDSLGVRILEMGFDDVEISMFILIPSEEIGPIETRLDTMMRGLTASSLRALMGGMRVEVVELQIPKFTFEMKMGVEMQQALENMGMTDLFDQNFADMSAFTTSAVLSIDKVIQKNHIEVNERGMEAAAATNIMLGVLSAQIPVNPILFHCNEPFLYMVFDKRINNMLFMGTYRNPDDF